MKKEVFALIADREIVVEVPSPVFALNAYNRGCNKELRISIFDIAPVPEQQTHASES
jgi:hypothetical protein